MASCLGLSLARHLLAQGANVAATTRSRDRLLAALDNADTTRLLPLEAQLTDQADVTRAVLPGF